MKACRILFFLIAWSSAAIAQEKVTYVFLVADVDVGTEHFRYLSTIFDQPRVNEECLTKLAQESIKLKAGDGATIGTIELESSGTFEEAEELILKTYTVPDRKTVYFKITPDC